MYGHTNYSQIQNYSMQNPLNYQPQMVNWQYPPPFESWPSGASGSKVIQNDPNAAILKKRQESQEFLNNFVNSLEESADTHEKPIENTEKPWSISEARETFVKAFNINATLESLSRELRTNEDLSETEWEKKYESCMLLQEELTKILNIFRDSKGFMIRFKKIVEERKKKRRREVRRKMEWRIEKKRKEERRVQRHAEADAWIQGKQDVIEREKQAELLRKDADVVLSDVRSKRADSKKYLGILQELKNLRRIKANIAEGRGEKISPAGTEAFNNIIDELVQQWTALDREYSIEEQGLKLMLKTDSDKKIEKQKKSTFDDWLNVLFGTKFRTTQHPNIFLTMRHAWDKYANFHGEGSQIPIGWVIPAVPSSVMWQKCLK